MGYATITSGGATGRYTIRIDYGQATKDGILAALSPYLTQVNVKIVQIEERLEALREKANAVQAQTAFAIADMIEKQNNFPPGSPERTDDKILKLLLQQRRDLQLQIDPVQAQLAAQKFERARVLKLIAYWNEFQPIEVRDVWCTDFTEDGAAGATCATLDLPGDSSLLLLAPGCRAPTTADGQLVARETMSPAQAFFNAAILPGWSKFQPTYRWGTITGINFEAGTADVLLGEARLTGQQLDVNQSRTLTAVPIEYMECNAEAFEVDDRVVVQFQGQSWAAPKIIGFLDNPQPCVPWPDVLLEYTPLKPTTITAASGTADWASNVDAGTDPGDCGPTIGTITEKNIVSIITVATTFETIRFDSTTWEADGFELILEDPTSYDWGSADGTTSASDPAPALNPSRSVYQTSGTVYERTADWGEITYPVYFSDPDADPPVICEIDSYMTGNFWSGYAEGDSEVAAFNRTKVETALGALPAPATFTVKVRRAGITKTYTVSDAGTSISDALPRTVRYSR